MNTQALARQFWREGFVVIENFFDAGCMDELDPLIRNHYEANPDFLHSEEFLSESRTQVIPWFPQNESPGAFDALDEHAGLKELTTAVLGEGWRRDYCMVMFSAPDTAGQAWHQDCSPDDPAQFNLNRLVYTTDLRDDAGGQIVVVPGSFRNGALPAGDPTGHFPGEIILTPRKGMLILLHGHCWHRVMPIGGGVRYSINYRAAPGTAREGITDVCVYRNMRYCFSTSSVVEKRA